MFKRDAVILKLILQTLIIVKFPAARLGKKPYPIRAITRLFHTRSCSPQSAGLQYVSHVPANRAQHEVHRPNSPPLVPSFVFGPRAQVKGLSIEHEKLAVAQRHAAENNNLPATSSPSSSSEPPTTTAGPTPATVPSSTTSNNSNGPGSNNSSTSTASSNGPTNAGEPVSTAAAPVAPVAPPPTQQYAAAVERSPDNGLARGIKRRTPTPAPPSPAATYSLPNAYSGAHYYDSPQKRLMR